MKYYSTQTNIGKAKYVVNFHDGIKKYADGSDFCDIAIFKNKMRFNDFVKSLKEEGYIEQ